MSDKGDWNPGEKYQTLIAAIQDVLSNGEERTVRDVYYALEARGDKYEYRYVKRAVKKGRRAGYIDPSQIIDSSRQPITVPNDGYRDPRHFVAHRVRGIERFYHENYWRYQDTYVEVWLEKQSLASVFNPICEEKKVRLEATRGDWSDSKVYEATQRLRDKILNGKDVVILYWGDYNPSGFHAPVSILDTMGYYGLELTRPFPKSDEPAYYDSGVGTPFHFNTPSGDDAGTLDFKRIALNTEHITRFDLPENPVPSSSDKDTTIKAWFKQYVSDGRDTNVELNALKEFERDFLEDLLRESIEEHVDSDRRERVNQRVSHAKDLLSKAITVDESKIKNFDPPI